MTSTEKSMVTSKKSLMKMVIFVRYCMSMTILVSKSVKEGLTVQQAAQGFNEDKT